MASFGSRLDHLVGKLREGGYRITPQRLAILEALIASENHPSVERLYEIVRQRFPTTSLATVYKTVSMMKEIGEVLELEFSHSSNRYDGNKPFAHPHLICTECKKILDPEAIDFRNLSERISRETGFVIVNHRLDFYGVCPQCQTRATG